MQALRSAPWQLSFVALGAIWGCSFLFIKLGLASFTPVEVAFGRLAIGATVLLLSGVMLPMSFAPEWLRTIASLNPLYHATLAIRALFNAEFSSPDVITGIVTTGIFALLSIFVASRAFNRQTA